MVPWCSRLQGFLVFLRPFASVMTAHNPSCLGLLVYCLDHVVRLVWFLGAVDCKGSFFEAFCLGDDCSCSQRLEPNR